MNTKIIIKARREAIAKTVESYGYGGRTRLAQNVGLSRMTISRMIKDEEYPITDSAWNRIAQYAGRYFHIDEEKKEEMSVAESPAEYGGPGMSIKTGEGGSIIVNIHAPTVHLHFADGAVDIKKL